MIVKLSLYAHLTLNYHSHKLCDFLEKLEEIKEQAKAKEAINANEKKLTPEQQEIKGFVDERNIIRLIHFAIYMYILREKNKQHVKKYNLLQIFNIILNTEISITLK
jgi:hypothetical protein